MGYYSKDLTKRIEIRVSEVEYAMLKKAAELELTTVSELIRSFIATRVQDIIVAAIDEELI